MPIPPINIDPALSQQSILQLREAVRLLTQHINNQEVEQQRLSQEQTKLKKVIRPDTVMQAPVSQQSQLAANVVRQAPLSNNITGLIGLLAQGQHTLVPQYDTTPLQADPAIINGSLFLDASNHLWYIDHTTMPFTFIDLTLAAMTGALATGTRAAKPAASAANLNTFYFETDTAWIYYSTGAAWVYVAGTYNGTRATRLALTISTADNNALFYETDYNLIWRVSIGAWVTKSIGTISVNITPVAVAANVITDQNLMSYDVPAGLLNVVGKTLRLTLSGLYDIDTALNVDWKVKLGGVTILTWRPQTPVGVLIDLPWRVQAEITCATTGAAGTVEAHGLILPENKITAGHQPVPQLDLNTAASAAIDLTAAATLQITIAFDVASVSNAGKQRSMILELLN